MYSIASCAVDVCRFTILLIRVLFAYEGSITANSISSIAIHTTDYLLQSFIRIGKRNFMGQMNAFTLHATQSIIRRVA